MFSQVFNSFLNGLTGIIILFIALSWVTFKIVEAGNILLNRHGQWLLGELAHCFGESSPGRFTNYFYWHPLISPLSQPPRGWPARHQIEASEDGEAIFTRYPPGRRPGHVAAETFAAVMLDPFPWPSTREALGRLLTANLVPAGEAAVATDPAMVDRLASTLWERRRQGADPTWQEALGEDSRWFDAGFGATKVDVYADPGSNSGGTPLDRLAQAWYSNRLAPEQLRATMSTLLREAESDVDHLRGATARWYREAMDRATGRFQRASMLTAFLVAAPICLALNVNLLAIGGRYSKR